MIHLIDSDEKKKLGDGFQEAPTTNCGLRLATPKVRFKNNWGSGQCKNWLDNPNVCGPCRNKSMQRQAAQFTYGVFAP